MSRRRSIWRYTGLFLTVLTVSTVWLFALVAAPMLIPPETPPPPNTISAYIRVHASGIRALADIVPEKDWETVCVIEKGVDPLMIARRRIGKDITQVIGPLIDEGLLDYLWKIVLVKDGVAAVHYFDERDVTFTNFNACMPFRDAMLSFDPFIATLYSKSALPK
jgi:hypothetical protein